MFEMYIVGMELDYKEEIFGSNFTFNNTKVQKHVWLWYTSFSI